MAICVTSLDEILRRFGFTVLREQNSGRLYLEPTSKAAKLLCPEPCRYCGSATVAGKCPSCGAVVG